MGSPAYIAIDTETGGLMKSTSLLTAYFLALDENFSEVDHLDIRLKPDDGEYRVTARALQVNGIDLIEHEKHAQERSIAGGKLRMKLHEWSGGGKTKLVPIGQNVMFDEERIWEQLLGRSTYEQYVSFRRIDTLVIAQYLRLVGAIPPSVSAGLSGLMSHFGLRFGEGLAGAHTAEGDARACVGVLRCMVDLWRSR